MTAAVAAAIPTSPAKGVALVRAWLLLIALMVYAMILVGGAVLAAWRRGRLA